MKSNTSKKSSGFHTKKSLGQNFLTDPMLLGHLVDLSGIPENAHVLEIGTGLGTLTEQLARHCAHVSTVEIDDTLIPILQVTFSGMRNVSLIHGNIMTLDINEITRNMRPYHVVANIPYYITTDLLNRLILQAEGISSISVMVQKEAAERITALPGTEQYGMLAVVTSLYGAARVVADVPSECFEPRPKVDSCFVTIRPYADTKYTKEDISTILPAARAAFQSRRKTYVNNLIGCYHVSRDEALSVIHECGLDSTIRGEELTTDQFLQVGRALRRS